VTGPVHVEGAEPGDLLRVDVVGLERRVPYGFISSRHGYGSLVGEFPEADGWRHDADAITLPETVSHFCRVRAPGDSADADAAAQGELDAGGGRRLPFDLAPFLGLMGVAVDTDAPVPSVPPGRHGGNIDVKHAVVGSTLYLPVQVAGAGFYTGDPHFAQGNGEVALTALEASLRATLRLTVLRAGLRTEAVGGVDVPMLETPTHWIPTGMDPDLDVAMQHAVRNAILFLHSRFDVPRSIAMAYLSAAGDFEVSQVVDAVKGVHCLIRKADFATWM
jgi:acetamidase/formamidase